MEPTASRDEQVTGSTTATMTGPTGGARTRSATRSRGRRARAAFAGLTALVLTAGACGPPAPTPVQWSTTRVARIATPTETVNHFGAWTDQDWFATVRVTTPIGGAGTSIVLEVRERQGPSGSVLGATQTVPLTADVGFGGPLGEHVVALGGTAAPGLPVPVRFFRPTAGVWGAAGATTLPAGYQLAAMTDDWLVARRVPGDPQFSGDGDVRVYAVDTSGPTVSVSFAASLAPDPVWPTALRQGFGISVALDGGLLAVGATGQSAPTPGAARVFRELTGTWTPVQSVGGSTEPSFFGRSLAVDDGPTLDRIAVGPVGDSPTTLGIDVLADAGSGFALEQRIDHDQTAPDLSGGTYFASAVALDGPLLALNTRTVTVPSADPTHPPVTVGRLATYRRTGTWVRERELTLSPDPADAGIRSALAGRLQASGSHVAASVFVTPDEPPGCVFPCFVLGFEAWSIDRS